MTGIPWPLKPAAMNLVLGGLAVEVRDTRFGGLYGWEVAGGLEDGDVADGVEDCGVEGESVLGILGTMPMWGRESDV